MMLELMPVVEVNDESADWLDVTDELLAAVDNDLGDCELICDVNTLSWPDSLHSAELMDYKMDPRGQRHAVLNSDTYKLLSTTPVGQLTQGRKLALMREMLL